MIPCPRRAGRKTAHMTTGSPALARRLGLGDATLIGLGSMIGAGVFTVLATAAATAGDGLVVGLLIAAVVAVCNAMSSAQLAAQYPVAGGTYVYGRLELGPWPGFVAGWCFVVGKTASCAAMALTFAAYAVPGPLAKPVAVAAVLALGAVNSFGVTRTALLTRIVVAAVLAVLAVVVVAGWVAPAAGASGPPPVGATAYGVLQSAGLLFFAFAGYARIATMGEEVRAPARTIPRAVLLALSTVLIVYLMIAIGAVHALGVAALARERAPLVAVVRVAGWGWAVPVVQAGAACAALGALLALIAGVGRTVLAMSRERDLPAWLGAVHPRFLVPRHAELALAVVVSGLILATDLRGAIGFSSFGVLLYYAVANLAALHQRPGSRRYGRLVPVVGLIGCAALVVTLPVVSIVSGVVVVVVGIGYRLIRLRVTGAPALRDLGP